MSFVTNYAVEGDDFSMCAGLNFKSVTEFIDENPDSNFVLPPENCEGRGKFGESSILPTDVRGKIIIKPATKFSFCNTEPNFELSSLPDSYDIKEEDTEESSIPLAVQCHRPSLSWADELLSVCVNTESQEQILEETCEAESGLGSILDDLQYGIKESLKKLPMYPQRDLLMTDFSLIEVINLNRQEHTSNFILRVYAPVAFRYFRELFGIATEDFAKSICDTPLCRCTSNSQSGSKFFSTYDDRFVLKTVPKKEANFIIDLFPGYFLNLTQHTKTLLPKYYGLYCYETATRSIIVLIMNNILPRSYMFHEKYDLKGSTYSKRRHCVKTCNEKCHISGATLKDLDFLDRWPEGFYLHHEIHKILLKSIERDCKVLESYNIMDYSLLLGIVIPDDPDSQITVSNLKLPRSSDSFRRNRSLIGPFEARTMKGDTVYLFVGIIDILQCYNWKRKLECHLKSLFYKKSTISVNRPDFYAQRFQNFLKDSVFKCIPKLVPSSKQECCIDAHRAAMTQN